MVCSRSSSGSTSNALRRRPASPATTCFASSSSVSTTSSYSLGFASSRAQGRQLVRHGHIEVNGKKINVPSYQMRKGDVIQVREKSRKNDQIRQAVETAAGRGVPSWLQLEPDQFRGTVTDLPKREDIRLPIQEQLIVELYSK